MMVVELAHPSHPVDPAVLTRRPPRSKEKLPPRTAPNTETDADRVASLAEPQAWPRIFPGI